MTATSTIDPHQRLLYLSLSVVISLLLHLVVWRMALHLKVPSISSPSAEKKEQTQIRLVDVDMATKQKKQELKDDNLTFPKQKNHAEAFTFPSEFLSQSLPKKLPSLFEKQMLIPRNSLPFSQEKIESYSSPLLSPPIKSITIPREGGISIPQPKHPQPPVLHLSPQLKFTPPVSSKQLTSNTPSFTALPSSTFLPRSTITRKEGEEAPVSVSPLSSKTTAAISSIPKPVIDKDIHSLDSLLDSDITVYRDPKTGEGFFQIIIRVNAQKILPPVPKDILILLDASSSITYSKLREFKRGLLQGLPYLHEADRLNIVVFRERSKTLFSEMVPPNQKQLERIAKAFQKIGSSGKTDLYTCLSPYISIKREKQNRPYILLLISDGRTTVDMGMEDAPLIRQIFQENTDSIPVFSFSAGKKANVFLMNFLSYTNRGFHVHVEKKRDIKQALSQEMRLLSTIVVTDLTYNTTEYFEEEMYPKKLPPLFRDYPLILYGKLEPGIKEIAIQILGKNRQGRREELIARLDFKTARQGDKTIAMKWATQKIYALLSQNIFVYSSQIEREIQEISQAYQIDISY